MLIVNKMLCNFYKPSLSGHPLLSGHLARSRARSLNIDFCGHLTGEKFNYKMVAMDDFKPSYLLLPNFPGFEF